MLMLSAKTRQRMLKELGFYDGKIDGKWGTRSKRAIKKLQQKYFRKVKDITGVYDTNTGILLRSAYNCHDLKHFKLEEFRCNCGHCTGYPATLDRQLVKNLDFLRDKSHAPITITSGLRCKWKNSHLIGSARNSRHLKGKAADIYSRELTNTRKSRDTLIRRWRTFRRARYAYGNTPNMGNAVHLDVQ